MAFTDRLANRGSISTESLYEITSADEFFVIYESFEEYIK